jgi:hypothetical protein
MEFDTEQIIKALECFHSRILNSNLAEKITEGEIMSIINALVLIKELTEENERLNRIIESYMLQYGTAVDKNVLIKPLGIDLK